MWGFFFEGDFKVLVFKLVWGICYLRFELEWLSLVPINQTERCKSERG